MFVIALCAMTVSVFTQMMPPQPPDDPFTTAPIVPGSVIIAGRQAVTDYLLGQVDFVTLNYTGRSLVSQNQQYLGSDELKSRGYIHKGSFTELSDALAKDQFSQQVVKTPEGYYDVRVEITAHSSDGRNVLVGGGYLNVNENKDGTVYASGDFQPWLSIPQSLIRKESSWITGAKWMALGHQDEELSYQQYSESFNSPIITSLLIPTRILENGYLVIADQTGNVSGVDLKNKTSITGQQVIALLGKMQSSDVISLKNPQSLSSIATNVYFYKSDGQIYGRFPLIDISTDTYILKDIFPSVKVWGTDNTKIIASKVIVKTLWVNDPKVKFPGEYEPPFNPSETGGGSLMLTPGGYHIEVKFDGVLDLDQNPNGGKG